MSLLKKLATSDKVTVEKDRIGGGGFVLDMDLYLLKIVHAYISTSESEAMALNVKFETEDGKTLRSQFWMTSGKEKGGKNTYIDKKGTEHYLPGFNQANSLCMLTVEQEIGTMDTEDKLLEIYNAEAKGEAPTNVPCLVDLFGTQVWAGVQKQIVDKTSKESGYQPTGETREQNEIDKFFHAETKQTLSEALAGSEAVFFETWKKEFAGKPAINKAKGAGVAGAPAKGGAPGAAASGKTTKPLFGKK
jgi:hypothetical protein